MSQEINLNVAPYFDDFNAANDYYKVLFKPGYPVQARELNNLQSILQYQIETFGQHFFKEGSKVIPGNTYYNKEYTGIQLESSFLGVPVSNYLGQLVGSKITGLTSGVTATATKCVLGRESANGNPTLYVSYLGSDSTDNLQGIFADNELLTSSKDIISGGTTIAAGEPFGSTLVNNSNITGSAFTLKSGVYFAKGTFVEVSDENILLDPFGTTPSYRIGLFINEQIVNADMDPTLNDNSRGFNNYSAPGADRLKITTSLIKKDLDDFDDNNFVQIATVENGVLRSQTTSTQYNILQDELARRTYAESGDYYVKPFGVGVKESLNNYQGNNGIFNADQLTYEGLIPSDDLGLYQISPGRAFVKGYDIETISSTYLDFQKPRTTASLDDQGINYNTGATLKLNNAYGSPQIGIGNTYVLSLRDTRVGSAATLPAGKEIGLARVYDFDLESGSYDRSNENINEWDLTLYDIQTVTEITLNESITLTVPSHIKGKYSGATAFIKSPVAAGVAVTVYDVKGDFIKNENFIIDGVENTRVAVAVTNYGISDIKSVFGNTNGPDMNTVGAAQTFAADTILTPITSIGVGTITQEGWNSTSGSISTVRSTSPNFPGQIRTGNLIRFSGTNAVDPVLASVVSVGTTHIVVAGVTTVTGVAEGKLPGTITQVSDLAVVGADLQKARDVSFYTQLPKNNIANVDLTDASLVIRKTQNVNITDGQLATALDAGANETFLPFTVERYFLQRSDGTTEVLTSDKVQINAASTQLQIYGLGGNDDAVLVTTLKKLKPKSKVKIRNRVNTLLVDKSTNEASGITTLTANDGLTYGNYPYGTRVQDEEISLNVPDAIQIHKVYESASTSDPSAPTLTLTSLTGPTGKTADLVIGEKVKGLTSNACGYVAESVTNSQITFIPQNEINFKEGETVLFEESQIQGAITTINTSSFDITSSFDGENGQKEDFYNYSIIRRKSDATAPNKKIKIYFSNGYYQSTDDGDVTTVDSYSTFNYSTEIQSVNGIRNTDLIDIRPRVSDYTVAEGSRSPLEFHGRTFNAAGNSAANILASDETIVTDFSWYLGRIDSIYLTKDGQFQVKTGVPSEKPEEPGTVDDALKIAVASLPAYLYNTSDVSLNFFQYKRYTMSDIGRLENRIKNLEYYTTLSLLEADTASLFLPDQNGINRFKSGFFVDNFTSFLAQANLVEYKNSIDIKLSELRPKHYTTSVDLLMGPVENAPANADLAFAAPQGTNIKKTGDIVSLSYNQVEYLKQVNATRTESVTPFIISFWGGTIDLTPASDNWVDTERLQANIIDVEGNFTQSVQDLTDMFGGDPQSGFGSVVWNSWEEIWSGVNQDPQPANIQTRQQWQGNQLWRTTFSVTDQIRTGTRRIVTEQFDQTSQGDRLVSRDLISFMRSRNVQFVGSRVKPSTRHYAFLDGRDVTSYCVPKLLEIAMVSGTFQVGETVTATTRPTGVLPITNDDARPSIRFRVAQSNHKEGPYNAPTKTYGTSPYGSNVVPSSYSTTSSTLNIDTFSLANEPQGTYWGWVEKDMILVGGTSGAMATISNVRLISDLGSNILGSLFIPNPNISSNPRFETGSKTLSLINNASNDRNNATSISDQTFTSTGILETVQEDIVSVRNANVSVEQITDQRTLTTQINRTLIATGRDPLAQSFLVEEPTGIFLTSCDVFFATVDENELPVTFQLRTMQNGLPTTKVIPFSEVNISPSDITISNDGSIGTTFNFKAPVYLEGGIEYCMVLLSDSAQYSVFISRVGEVDLLTQTFVSQQPTLGSLFKSQNASTWEPSQWEDLKYSLYRADFATTGSIELYNPELTVGNKQIANLLSDPLQLTGRKIKVGIGSTLNDADLTVGNTVLQYGSNATGTYVGNAGIATGTLNIINAGIGYTPTSGSYEFTQVPLTNITASGNDALADITIENGVVGAATISEYVVGSGGTGYVPGDVLGIGTIGNNSLGLNARLSLVSIANTSQLILDNVQGDFITGTGKTVRYINNTGLTTDLNGANNVGGNVTISDIETVNTGLDIVVNHKNHGMYFTDNYVTVSKVQTDLIPTKLVNDLATTETGNIEVDSATNFDEFENVGVGTTNYGYLKIGEEILSYESADGTTIGITSRTIDDTTTKNYLAGTPVYKYELGGVSLRRINKTHYLGNVSIANSITFDSYNIKLDMGSSGLGRSTGESFPILYMGQTKSAGGDNVTATQNIPFEIINPQIQNLTLPGTDLTSEVRTVTGASLDGNEIPYVDKGFEGITLGQNNYMSTPRIVASNINQTNNLSTLPGNKSLNMRVNLTTTDSKLSPMIDTQRMSVIFSSNRVNAPISNYVTDNRVNSAFDDPNAFQYLSKEFQLENSATTLKIISDAYINTDSDIRAFYAISNSAGTDPVYMPFPGYNNIDDKGQIIDVADNDGRSDSFIFPSTNEEILTPSNEFKEYTFSINDLPSFKFYRIKIVMTSTSQSYPPRMRNLRVLALA